MKFLVTIGDHFYNHNGDEVKVVGLLTRAAKEGEDTDTDGNVLVTELVRAYEE